MASVFYENSGLLKCPALDATFGELSGLGAGYFTLLCAPFKLTSLSWKSTASTDIGVYLVAPGAVNITTPQLWFTLSNGDTLTSESLLAPQLHIPPKTKILLKPIGADPASGKVTLIYFGG